jgi:hypothetical protein
MTDAPPTLRDTFVAAFPIYVATVLTDRGISIEPVIADGIVIGTGVLDGLLTTLEATPPALAPHSPLELFREALRPVDRALDVAGIEPPTIDSVQRELLPWDRYALSPGSSAPLGAQAHAAHLQWGIEKVRAHAIEPVAGLRCAEADAPRLLEQFNALGYRVLRLPTSEAVSVGVVDLDSGGVDPIVVELATAGSQVIVFGSDPDDIQQSRFKALGATAVLPKHMLLEDLAAHIPAIA